MSVTRSFSMPEALSQALDGGAQHKGVPASQIVRWALRAYLTNLGEDSKSAMEFDKAHLGKALATGEGVSDIELAAAWPRQ